jgi:hypothetical protein
MFNTRPRNSMNGKWTVREGNEIENEFDEMDK